MKKVSFIDDVSEYTSYTFKPQLRTVGPKYGKVLGKIKAALETIDGHAAMAQLKKEGSITLTEVGEDVVLTEEDLLISVAQTPGFATETGNDITVVLDTNLTPELIEEGFVREIISKVQTMRKEAGFEVMDKILLSFTANDKISDVFAAHKDEIKSEVLAVDIKDGELSGYQKEWNINGQKVKLGVEKQNE
jgi:isoleucyl-tRNA synthetase